MRRIRVVLALVSVATLCLVTLLAWRANQGLAAERAVRHEAVAERTFEEMERALTAFLAREEARPFEHYAYYVPVSGERSPLAAGLEPFVVGAFQLDPEGAVTTPLESSRERAGDSRNTPQNKDADQLAARRVRRAVDGLWSSNAAGAALRADEKLGKKEGLPSEEHAKRDTVQAPGTTRVVSGPGVGFRQERAAEEVALEEPESRNAYDVLESLNRAVDDRAERKQKVAQASKAAVYGGSEPYAAAAAESDAPLPSSARALPPTPAEPSDARARVFLDEGFDAESSLAGPSPAAPTSGSLDVLHSLGYVGDAGRSNAIDAVRIALDPMVGVSTEDDLVLYRTVLVDRRGYRQGLVLDRDALGAWLEDRIIRASGLAEVVSVSFSGAAIPAAADHFVFAHRFAEPFDGLHAQLTLAPLPGVASPGVLYALVLVLLIVGAAGLMAVHHTVSVAVSYAERRSNFVAAVSHELKTPLTAIRMYSEMLRDGLVSGDAKRREYYATITDESERLSRLVDNVLEFSKLEGGRRELAITVGAVGPVLEEALEKLGAHAAREGFDVSVDIAPDLPAVRFDRDALLQVIFNLVDNAMKYAKGSAQNRIELEARRDGDAVIVSVRDFGPGVSHAHLGHVFEPFYRGESELTRNTKGTGIGLALVKELAERMGASVGCANADDGGFRVRLVFPVPAPA
jgi:signal transduction histidine kinase